MIYLDNSSTTYHKPRFVKKTLKKYLKKYSANPGRSGHSLSLKTADKIFEARCNISDYFGLDKPENVIFTSSCTESLNLGLLGTAKPNGHIVSTIYEHNSVLRTLSELKEGYNISYTLVAPNKHGQITSENIAHAIKDNTYLVVVNHTSNVTGHTQDIYSIGALCKNRKIKFMVDSAQSGGHELIDMNKANINMLAVSGHKGFLSVQCGALLIRDIVVKPLKFGGTGTNSLSVIQPTDYPDGLEAGTALVSNILCLDQGVKYNKKNFYKIHNKVKSLTRYLLENLKQIPQVKIYSTNLNSGVVSISVGSVPSTDISTILNDDYKICVRSGLHCAPMVHEFLGTKELGLVRISMTHQNNKFEIYCLIRAIKKIVGKM